MKDAREENPAPAFASAKELRGILENVLREIDQDPNDGPRLRRAAAPVRFEFSDLKLVLNLAPDPAGDHCVKWDFSSRAVSTPALHLTMDSSVANRFLQGRENTAIALVRGRIHADCNDAASVVRVIPAVRPLFDHYRQLIARDYPHLALD